MTSTASSTALTTMNWCSAPTAGARASTRSRVPFGSTTSPSRTSPSSPSSRPRKPSSPSPSPAAKPPSRATSFRDPPALHFLEEVGLGYLQLDRSAKTLSAGKPSASASPPSSAPTSAASSTSSTTDHRPTSARQPEAPRHPRGPPPQGKLLLVVEHDDDTMARAGHIIDLGPGAGRHGGEVIAAGSVSRIKRLKKSVTGQALRHPLSHPIRGERRPLPKPGAKTGWLRLKGCTLNNLKDIEVRIPLQRLTVITGISGCGKSSLMRGTLAQLFQTSTRSPSTSSGPEPVEGSPGKEPGEVVEVGERLQVHPPLLRGRPVAHREDLTLVPGNLRQDLRRHPQALCPASRVPPARLRRLALLLQQRHRPVPGVQGERSHQARDGLPPLRPGPTATDATASATTPPPSRSATMAGRSERFSR